MGVINNSKNVSYRLIRHNSSNERLQKITRNNNDNTENSESSLPSSSSANSEIDELNVNNLSNSSKSSFNNEKKRDEEQIKLIPEIRTETISRATSVSTTNNIDDDMEEVLEEDDEEEEIPQEQKSTHNLNKSFTDPLSNLHRSIQSYTGGTEKAVCRIWSTNNSGNIIITKHEFSAFEIAKKIIERIGDQTKLSIDIKIWLGVSLIVSFVISVSSLVYRCFLAFKFSEVIGPWSYIKIYD